MKSSTSNPQSEIFNLKSDAVYIFILLIIPVFMLRIGNSDYLAGGDNYLDQHPHSVFLINQVLEGIDPAWNPYICAGMPEAGYGNVSLYYPLNWIHAVLPAATAFNFFMLMSYFLASLGMYLFAKTWKLRPPVALLTATTFAYGSFMLGWLHALEAASPGVWLGWLFLCLELLRRSLGNHRRSFLITLATGLVWGIMAVSGHPQITIYGSLTAVVYCVYFIFRGRAPWSYLGWVVLAGIMGMMLAAPHLLPGLTLSEESYRSALTFKRFTSPHLTAPQFLGSIFFINAPPGLILSAYIGIVPFALILVALFKKLDNPVVPLGLGVIIAAFFLAIGRSTGLDLILFHVPVYNLFSFHSRHTLEMTFFAAMLAGVGLNALMDEKGGALFGFPLMAVLMAVLLVSIALTLLLMWLGGSMPGPELLIAPAVALPALAIAGAGFSIRKMNSPAGRDALITVAVLVLLLEPYLGILRPRMPFNDSRNTEPQSVTSKLVKKLETGRNPPSRLFALINLFRGGRDVIHDGCQGNLGMVQRVHGTACYHPSMLGRFKEVTDLDLNGWPNNIMTFLDAHNRSMDLLATRYFSFDPRYMVSWRKGIQVYTDENGVATEYGEVIDLNGQPGKLKKIWLPDFEMDAVGIVSTMGNVSGIEQGRDVARLTFTGKAGERREITLKAGMDTALFNHESFAEAPEVQYTVQGISYYGMETWYLEAGESATVEISPFNIMGVGLMTYLIHSDTLKDGDEAARIVFNSPDGERLVLSLKVGEHTGDWAMEDPGRSFSYGSPKVYRRVKPREGMDFMGRDYPALLLLPKLMKVDSIVLESALTGDTVLVVEDATLLGARRGEFIPLATQIKPLHERPPYFPPEEYAPPGYHTYASRLELGESFKPKYFEMEYLLDEGFLSISHLTMINSEKKEFFPVSRIDMALGDMNRFRPVYGDGSITVMENMNALPRAWLAEEARVMPFEQIVTAVQTGQFTDGTPFDPLKTVLLEEPPELPQMTDVAEPAYDNSIKFDSYSANEFSMSVSCTAPMWLVLSEVCYPGWEALVDGQEWPIFCGDGMLRTLPLTPGHHKVELSFHPPMLKTGRYIGLGTLIFIILSGLLIAFKSPKNRGGTGQEITGE